MKAGDQLTLPAVQDAAGRYEDFLVKDIGRTRPEARESSRVAAAALSDGLSLWTEPALDAPPAPMWESERGDSAEERTENHVRPVCSPRCPWMQPARYRMALALAADPLTSKPWLTRANCAHPSRSDGDTQTWEPCWPVQRLMDIAARGRSLQGVE